MEIAPEAASENKLKDKKVIDICYKGVFTNSLVHHSVIKFVRGSSLHTGGVPAMVKCTLQTFAASPAVMVVTGTAPPGQQLETVPMAQCHCSATTNK